MTYQDLLRKLECKITSSKDQND